MNVTATAGSGLRAGAGAGSTQLIPLKTRDARRGHSLRSALGSKLPKRHRPSVILGAHTSCAVAWLCVYTMSMSMSMSMCVRWDSKEGLGDSLLSKHELVPRGFGLVDGCDARWHKHLFQVDKRPTVATWHPLKLAVPIRPHCPLERVKELSALVGADKVVVAGGDLDNGADGGAMPTLQQRPERQPCEYVFQIRLCLPA